LKGAAKTAENSLYDKMGSMWDIITLKLWVD